MDRVNLTSLSLALIFLCIALLVHTSSSSSIDESLAIRERSKRAEAETATAGGEETKLPPRKISDDPYDRPDNFALDMYRLLAIALFVGFAIVMYFVVWRFCSGPPA